MVVKEYKVWLVLRHLIVVHACYMNVQSRFFLHMYVYIRFSTMSLQWVELLYRGMTENPTCPILEIEAIILFKVCSSSICK